MKNFTLVSLLVTVSSVVSCGRDKSSANSAEKASKSETSSSKADSQSSSKAETTVVLDGRPVYQIGKCKGEVGCIKGFISHGTAITLNPADASADRSAKTLDGQSLTLKTYVFNDAQDFGDRFDTAFLAPLVPEDKRKQYDFKVLPTVKRDNFANQFELYAEGLESHDSRVQMKTEGNFVIGDMQPYEGVILRAVKTFRIEATKYDDKDPKVVTGKSVTCLEIQTEVKDLKVEAGKDTLIGALKIFSFYYTEDESLCANLADPSASNSNPSGSQLPATKPNIP